MERLLITLQILQKWEQAERICDHYSKVCWKSCINYNHFTFLFVLAPCLYFIFYTFNTKSNKVYLLYQGEKEVYFLFQTVWLNMCTVGCVLSKWSKCIFIYKNLLFNWRYFEKILRCYNTTSTATTHTHHNLNCQNLYCHNLYLPQPLLATTSTCHNLECTMYHNPDCNITQTVP